VDYTYILYAFVMYKIIVILNIFFLVIIIILSMTMDFNSNKAILGKIHLLIFINISI